MRRTRWLVLAALIVTVAAVGYIYFARLATLAKNSPEPVRPLPSGVEATAQEWHYSTKNGDCPVLEVRAKNFKQIKEPATFELEGVDLQLFHDCGKIYDHVQSAKAHFDTASGTMFSDGEVQITKGVPAGEEASGKLMKIVSSGVKFETKAGSVSTDRAARFTFDGGSGTAVGAEYDPNTHQLQLKNDVHVDLKPKGPNAKPLKIETQYLVYLEKEDKVVMQPWSRLTRGTLVLNAAMSVASMQDGVLRHVEATNAWGVQDDPGRKLEYQAEQLHMWLNEDARITNLNADRNAHLVSTSDTARTDVKGDSILLEFTPGDGESTLTRAIARGNGVVDSNPIARAGIPQPDTRILKSNVIELRMRPGGKEIDNAETEGPGSLELIPNRAGQPHRTLNGDKLWITYAANNQIKTFRSVNVTTRTVNPPRNNKPQPPVITSSRDFNADFDPKTNQMTRLEQSTNFRYEEGERKAWSDRATLDQAANRMTLIGAARVVDPGGSANADRIDIDQKTGDMNAEGRVASTRLPDKKGNSSAMLSKDEPIQAKADRMTSRDDNRLIVYEGNAVAWQGPNRIQADRLDIDRKSEIMKAAGSVVSQFADKPPKDKQGKPLPTATTLFTVVRAPEMTYVENDRVARYTSGVVLTRPNMTVRSRELQAFLNDKDQDSSLNKAFADGNVSIVQTAPGRTRTGTSEHAEYYAADEKIILEKGQPKFVDSVRGTTEGQVLTYYSKDDRLLVNGVESRRAESILKRKK